MAILEVAGLTKRYGARTALDQVSLRVDAGECLAILGPNGAGKSTLIRAVTTLVRPDEGSVVVAGSSAIADPMAARHAIGVAFQEPLLDKALTGREVLEHHAKLYGVPRAARGARIEALARALGVEDRLAERVSRLSGGLRRRLDLARALVSEPRLLVLDEPTTGLDLPSRRRLWATLRELADQGKALLLATHDMEEAEAVADRVAILHEGHLLAEGTPEHLKEGLGRRVIRIESADRHALGQALSGDPSIDELTAVAGGVEVILREGHAGAAHVMDLLESREVSYTRATVREPTLGDVFMRLTGRELVPEPHERPRMDRREAAAAVDAALAEGPEEGTP